jgi:hypothetical protein
MSRPDFRRSKLARYAIAGLLAGVCFTGIGSSVLGAPSDCSCEPAGEAMPMMGEGPCGIFWELTLAAAPTSTPCDTNCAIGPGSGCSHRPVAKVWVNPVDGCETPGALIGWHIITQHFSVDCNGAITGPIAYFTGESHTDPDPSEVIHRFGTVDMPCGGGLGFNIKVWLECTCPTAGVIIFAPPPAFRHCKKCCP